MEDLFEKQYALLITNVVADGKPVDIFIDETGTIAGIGEDLRKTAPVWRNLSSTGTGRSRSPGSSIPTPMRP